jgi:hypothetical protein
MLFLPNRGQYILHRKGQGYRKDLQTCCQLGVYLDEGEEVMGEVEGQPEG